ncbi:MAG: sigma-70 family RNA polymerase sigma factor [Elusimicrobia bacterium]|nr:sigma-70 family RNA polymerase sigma factor [Elusimicrobiota bacterium]
MTGDDLAREWVLKAREGDTEAFAELVKAFGPAVYRLALSITGDPADAADAAQESFLRAYWALSRFDPDRPFRPWILKIVWRRAMTRAGRRRDAPLEEAEAMPERVEAQTETPPVREGLARLSPEDRSVLAFKYEEGMSIAEIAGLWGLSETAVKVRLFRARERLLKNMREES